MEQSCYFAEVCDHEFNKKHIRVNLFSLQLWLHEYRLTILYEKWTRFVSRCGGLLLEDSGVIARCFEKSRKLMICAFKFSFKCSCRVSQQIKIFHVQ